MKAAQYSRFGGPEVLEIVDVPDPHPGPGQVRIVVRAAGISGTDWKLRQGVLNYLPVGALIGAVLLAELLTVVFAWVIGPDVAKAITAPIPPAGDISNTQALGLVLYTRYVYYFQTAGIILLVAMIGAIVLTLQHKPNVRRQNIADQVARRRDTAIDVVKVKSGQGLQ